MLINSISRITRSTLNGRLISTCTLIPANKNGRQLALPITFLSVKGWEEKSVEDTWLNWAKLFSNKGYSSLLIEIDPEEIQPPAKDSKSLLDQLETKLTTILANSDSPFPPLLISSHLSTLLAETYVSSHPLTGLLLYSPPHKPEIIHELTPKIFKTEIQPFDYEPHFHLAVMEPKVELLGGRLLKDFNEEEDKGKVIGLIGEINEEGWEIVMDWADQL